MLLALLLLGTGGEFAHAQAVSGPEIFADGGVVEGGSTAPAAPAAWFGGVTVASTPLRMGRNWHFSTSTGLSREPALGMTVAGGRVAPVYFDAVRATGSLWFVHTSGPFDVAIVGRYAETRIDEAQEAAPARNDTGLWTFLFEATAHLRVYAHRDADAPAAARRLMPALDVYGGVKHDRRFHRNGDLDPFDDPTGRAIGGVFVSAWRRLDAAGLPRIVVGGGGDFETALRTGVRLPGGGRAFVRADVAVRRRFVQ